MKRLAVASGASSLKLFGKVLQNELIIEEGALFEGETKIKKSTKINDHILDITTKNKDNDNWRINLIVYFPIL